MAFDSISLGGAPASEEDIAQVGRDEYPERSRRECMAFKRQLLRTHPIPPELEGEVRYKIKTERHDLGNYREVHVEFNVDNSAAVDFAFRLEGEAPTTWDAESLAFLGIEGAELSLAAEGMEFTSI